MLALFFPPLSSILGSFLTANRAEACSCCLGVEKVVASFDTKGPALFLAERAAWSDSLGGVLAVPQPELLPIYDNIIPFAFRDALYASSVRLTQKYVSQAISFTPLAVYPAGRTQRPRGGCHSSLDKGWACNRC